MNTYGYVEENPLAFIDLYGLDLVVGVHGPILSNPFGHSASAVTGSGVQSYGTYHADGSSFSEYVLDEAKSRDSTYFIHPSTPEQDKAMSDAYYNFKKLGTYDKYTHNCSEATAAVIKAGHLNDTLDKYLNRKEVYPNTIAVHLFLRGKQEGFTEVYVPKGTTTVPEILKQFDPR